MTTTRLFHRFRAHETVTLVAFDLETRRMTYLDPGGRQVDLAVQAGLSIDIQHVPVGTKLRIQHGEITNWTSDVMGGRRFIRYGNRHIVRSIYTGGICISAIAHPVPLVLVQTVRLMEAAFGPETAAMHLRHFGDGASTLQEDIVQQRERYSRRIRTLPVEMTVKKGVLSAARNLAPGVRLDGCVLQINDAKLPQTMLSALAGRPVSDLVAHPALRDPELTIERVVQTSDGAPVYCHLVQATLSPQEAIARLAADLPMAA